MSPGQKQADTARRRLDRAAHGMASARGEMAAAARAARDAGVSVNEIAERLGYRTRRSVYQLLADETEPRTRR